MNTLIKIILLSFILVTSAYAERTRDIVIRDFNKNISFIKLDDNQKQKWDVVISTIFNLHDKLGGYGKWSKISSPWVQYPGHWYIYTNQNESVANLLNKYVELQVSDYQRVIKEHVAIHNAIEEFDNSLDASKRKAFRSNFRDLWIYVYDKMTDQLGQQLDKEIKDTKSFVSNLKLNKEQKIIIDEYILLIEKSRKDTVNVKSQGKKDVAILMNNPDIPWGDNPMSCKNFFNAYSQTLSVYADSLSKIELVLDNEQRLTFQKNVTNKYLKEFDSLTNASK